VLISRTCEAAIELLIYGMLVFTPWAFGTTERWSVWATNIAGCGLGFLWLGVRWNWLRTGCRRSTEIDQVQLGRGKGWGRFSTVLLAGLTISLLGYTFISAANARATFLPNERRFDYHQCIDWLPHSLDSNSTWRAFWTYISLGCLFWVARDWLSGQTSAEQKARRGSGVEGLSTPLPARLKRLLWVLAINGALLALEGIVQRQSGCPKLLFLVQPAIHHNAESQFGPFAYRANAAQYFNLLWPACLGFWWALQTELPRHARHHWQAGCVLVMAACPFLSTSRGGALVAFGLMFALSAIFLTRFATWTFPHPFTRRPSMAILALVTTGAPLLGMALGWHALGPRWGSLKQSYEERERAYTLARRIAYDYPVYGTGPGTYEVVSELYRPNETEFWPAQVHNDWLETRITFGVVGSAMVGLTVLLILSRLLCAGVLPGGNVLSLSLWLGLVGCLVHARFDFPFQIYSILSLFVVLTAVLFAVTSPNPNPRGGRSDELAESFHSGTGPILRHARPDQAWRA